LFEDSVTCLSIVVYNCVIVPAFQNHGVFKYSYIVILLTEITAGALDRVTVMTWSHKELETG